MSRTTTHGERMMMIERHLAGDSLPTIAIALQRSPYTVRTIWRRFRQHGWDGLLGHAPGPPATGPLGRAHPRIKYVLLRLKRQHPGWGVDKLRLELTRRPSLQGIAIPKRSTLATYLQHFRGRLGHPRHWPTHRPPAPRPVGVHDPHQCWQMDFKGDEPVGGCHVRIAPLLVCDEASGAPLGGHIHVLRGRGDRTGLTARDVQADLRALFTRWGLPDALRMDRDPLFVGSGRLEWPGTVLLWLIGLAIQPVVNRAYRPTDNAIVERNHQTWQAHVLEGQVYSHVDAVQQATEQAFADRRTSLPSRHRGCNGHPFQVAFPTLTQPRRPYTPQHERQLFDLGRVDAYLAHWIWRRTVDCSGQISLANRNYRVGHAYRGQRVTLHFDATDRTLVCQQANGQDIARLHVPEIQAEYILGLD